MKYLQKIKQKEIKIKLNHLISIHKGKKNCAMQYFTEADLTSNKIEELNDMLDYESDDTISESSKNHDDQTTNAEEKTEVLHYNTPIRIDLSESSKPLK